MPQHSVLDTKPARRCFFSDFFNPSLPYALFQAIENEQKTSPVLEDLTCKSDVISMKFVGFEN
ncbi:hypothetical protein N7501_007800 [Penicillium viridicatum]|nr:hypothetical protein N7501_007800 [Penicillium viridicatum]